MLSSQQVSPSFCFGTRFVIPSRRGTPEHPELGMPAPLPPTLPGRPLVGSGPEAVADPLGLYARAQRELGDVVRFRGIAGIK